MQIKSSNKTSLPLHGVGKINRSFASGVWETTLSKRLCELIFSPAVQKYVFIFKISKGFDQEVSLLRICPT